MTMRAAIIAMVRPQGQVVPIARVRRAGSVLRFVEGCPYCGQKHEHGVGDGGRAGWHGHRVAHCPIDTPCGYYLLEEGAPVLRAVTA